MIVTQDIISPLLEISDPSFDHSQCTDYELLMEMSHERFRFCVLDASKKRVLALEDYSIDVQLTHQSLHSWIQNVVHHHPYLGSTSWKNVAVSFNTPHFTLVPDIYFRKEYVASYLNLVRATPLSDEEQVLHHAIKALAARNVFATNKTFWDGLLSMYSPQAPIALHQTSALIQGVITQSQGESTPCMCLYFEEGFMTVAIAHQGTLLICNKFAYKTSEDMTYFVVFVLDSLQLKSTDIRSYLYGEITPYSEEFQLIKRFLASPTFGTRPVGVIFGDAFDDLPEHRYFTLFNMPFAISTK